jgi:hypothetical protein
MFIAFPGVRNAPNRSPTRPAPIPRHPSRDEPMVEANSGAGKAAVLYLNDEME